MTYSISFSYFCSEMLFNFSIFLTFVSLKIYTVKAFWNSESEYLRSSNSFETLSVKSGKIA